MATFSPPTSVEPPPTRKPSDIHTLSSISSFRPLHLHLEWTVNWDKKLISGSVEHTIRALKSGETELRLDSSYLDILSVTLHGRKVTFNLEPRKNSLGSPLVIALPRPSTEGEEFKLHIEYSTTAQCTALGWLSAEQTAAKTAPFLYSQCQAIHCRSLVPLFDSPWWKVTYTATVKSQYPILMSALPVDPKDHSRFLDPVTPTEAIANPHEVRTYGFSQRVSIPSYLIAIVAGHLAFAPLGPRTGLWAEKPDLPRCKWEFETNAEKYLKALEEIVSPYSWTRYDSVVLPPSFPYGGMENANMTTLTPTLIVGDRSQCDVLLHELSHSWSGNLTSCGDWSSFWLNEGMNVWLERLALQYVHGAQDGPAYRGFSYIIGAKALLDARKQYEENPRFQRLVPVFTEGEDPDDAFSSIPYEAGSNLILHLEQTVGGLDNFLPFIKSYFKTFFNRSVTTQDFIDHLYAFYASSEQITSALKRVDWQGWLHGEGLALPEKMTYDDSLAQESYALAKRWSKVIKDSDSPKSGAFSQKDIESFDTDRLVVFMERLHEDSSLKFEDKYAKHMDEVYKFTSEKSTNGEVMLRFFELALEDKDSSFVEQAAEWVSKQGRMKYNRPIFRSLAKVAPELAKKTFMDNKSFYHPIAAAMIQKTLRIRSESVIAGVQSHDVIAVVGSTGTGKSQLGVEIAEYVSSSPCSSPSSSSSGSKYRSASIISADSMQIYHGLDVITNKATVSEMASVPHHLMSFLPVGEEYDVGKFCGDAKALGEEMLKEARLPIVVGGTTYYIQHLLFPGKVVSARLSESRNGARMDDHDETEQRGRVEPRPRTVVRDEVLAQRIEALPSREAETWRIVLATSPTTLPDVPPLSLWQLLHRLDPAMAKRWHPQDARKISNSLRVIVDTGRLHSDWVREQEEGSEGTASLPPTQWHGKPLRVLLLWVWASRDELNLRLDRRVEKMIPAGLLAEICELREIAERMRVEQGRPQTDYTRGIFQSIGYKEFGPFLDALDLAGISGQDVDLSTLSPEVRSLFDKGLEDMKTATRQYAKKQVMWMKNKLLPEVRRRREGGQDVQVVLLDTSDTSKWQENVKQPALDAVKSFLAHGPLPDSVRSEASIRELQPLLRPLPSDDGLSTVISTGSSLSSNTHILCEVCTHFREEDTHSLSVYYRQADEKKHQMSKGHRYALNRMKTKERLDREGTLADESDVARRKREERAQRRAGKSIGAATLHETNGYVSEDDASQSQSKCGSDSDLPGKAPTQKDGQKTQNAIATEDTSSASSAKSDPCLDAASVSYRQACGSMQRQQPASSPLPFLLAFHFLLAIVTLTFFQPDEFWQSQEVAHRLAFGYGYSTWEWRHEGREESWYGLLRGQGQFLHAWNYIKDGPVRSVVHPLMFVPGYLALKWTGLDDHFALLTTTPRLLQAALSAVAAHHTYLIAAEFVGTPTTGYATLFSLLTSPYYLYTATRTFSNTAEASLSTIALYHWLRCHRKEMWTSQWLALGLAALACLVRPTNAIMWVWLLLKELFVPSRDGSKGRSGQRLLLLLRASIVGIIALSLTAILDSSFHSRPTLPLVPFLHQNVIQSISLFYGSNPWHWYISQGLPILGLTALPSMIFGARRLWWAGGIGQSLVSLTVWILVVYSLLGHKEWRFLQPSVPLLHIMAGSHLAPPSDSSSAPPSASAGRTTLSRIANCTNRKKLLYLHLSSLPLAVYLLVFHCIGQSLTLPLYLRRAYSEGSLKSVGFLMPCHSTPWQSHFHIEGLQAEQMWFLSCEPPRGTQDVSRYQDESDHFYHDALHFLDVYLPPRVDPTFPSQPCTAPWRPHLHGGQWHPHPRPRPEDQPPLPLHQWPTHLVTFSALTPSSGEDTPGRHVGGAGTRSLAAELQAKGYQRETEMGNALFHDDHRRRGSIVVWRWKAETESLREGQRQGPSSSSSSSSSSLSS